MRWLLLFLGGGVGTVLRAVVSAYVQVRVDGGFPWGVLTVNLLGCFAIGLLFAFDDARGGLGESGRLLLITGLLGGFTTFSAFGLDLWRLASAGELGLALANAGVSLAGGLLAVALGIGVARSLA